MTLISQMLMCEVKKEGSGSLILHCRDFSGRNYVMKTLQMLMCEVKKEGSGSLILHCRHFSGRNYVMKTLQIKVE